MEIDPYEFYYIRPAYTIHDFDNDFIHIPYQRTVTAYRDTTEFFFPDVKVNIRIINEDSERFNAGSTGFVANSFTINFEKSHIDLDKYILLADKVTSQLPVSYRIYVNDVVDPNVVISVEAEYIVLKMSLTNSICLSCM